MAYPHKWSPISYKSSAGQRKDTGQTPMLYRWTTQPTKAFIDNRKNLVNSSMSSTCSYNMANFGPLTAEICWRVWGNPCSKFQRVSRLAFVTTATSLTEGQPNFARCLAVSCAATLYIHFRGLLPLTEFCQVQNSRYVQVLCSRILAALRHGGHHVGHRPTFLFFEPRNFAGDSNDSQ